MSAAGKYIGLMRTVVFALAAASLAGCAAPQRMGANDPTLGANTLNVARTAIAGNRPDLALHVANAVLKVDPGNNEARLVHGDAAYLLGDCRTASADYQAVLKAAPRSAGAEIGLGRCALRTGGQGAVAAFRQATSDDPRNAVAFNDLGVALAERGAFGAAVPAFRKALAFRPSFAAARANLGLATALEGQPGAGAAIIAPLAQGQNASPAERANYAAALAMAGDEAAAQRVLSADMPAAEAHDMVAQLARISTVPHAGHPPHAAN